MTLSIKKKIKTVCAILKNKVDIDNVWNLSTSNVSILEFSLVEVSSNRYKNDMLLDEHILSVSFLYTTILTKELRLNFDFEAENEIKFYRY